MQIDIARRSVAAISPTHSRHETQTIRLTFESQAGTSIYEISEGQRTLYFFPNDAKNRLLLFECLGSFIALFPNRQSYAKARVSYREQTGKDSERDQQLDERES